MRFALFGKDKIKVKVLGTEEGYYHIEFENGSSILASEDELEFID